MPIRNPLLNLSRSKKRSFVSDQHCKNGRVGKLGLRLPVRIRVGQHRLRLRSNAEGRSKATNEAGNVETLPARNEAVVRCWTSNLFLETIQAPNEYLQRVRTLVAGKIFLDRSMQAVRLLWCKTISCIERVSVEAAEVGSFSEDRKEGGLTWQSTEG